MSSEFPLQMLLLHGDMCVHAHSGTLQIRTERDNLMVSPLTKPTSDTYEDQSHCLMAQFTNQNL